MRMQLNSCMRLHAPLVNNYLIDKRRHANYVNESIAGLCAAAVLNRSYNTTEYRLSASTSP
jgi:hypothetical protein